jgi:aminoglycoside phosphotransferase (APT) family kinase protein
LLVPEARATSSTLDGALASWATQRFGGEVAVAAPAIPVGGGFDAELAHVQLAGSALPPEWRRPLVVRAMPRADRWDGMRDEAAVMRWCAGRGYPTPEVLAELEPGTLDARPVMVMLRLPGVPMADLMQRAPWRIPRLVDLLAELHLRLHALSTDGWPLASTPTALPDRRLGLARRVFAETGDRELGAALDRAEQLVPSLVTDSPVVCHGDLHPYNVLVDGSEAYVVDWTDAALGDLHGDVSRAALLFEVASVFAPRPLRALMVRVGPRLGRRFLHAYERGRSLDHDRLRGWETLHLVHGLAQAISLGNQPLEEWHRMRVRSSRPQRQ